MKPTEHFSISQFARIPVWQQLEILNVDGVLIDTYFDGCRKVKVFFLRNYFVEVTSAGGRIIDIIPFKRGFRLPKNLAENQTPKSGPTNLNLCHSMATGPALWLLIVALLVFVPRGIAQKFPQKIRFGAGAELFCSGSGHGPYAVQYLDIVHGRQEFMFGPMTQLASQKTNGIKVAYSLNLSGQEVTVDEKSNHNLDPVQLNFISSVNYSFRSCLSQPFISDNSIPGASDDNSWQSIRLSTIDASTGIEMRANFTDQICLRFYSMFNYYYRPVYFKLSCLNRQGVTLGLGISLQYVMR